jgi:hypothetical protein
MAKAKAIEAELLAEEREIMLVDTTKMTEGKSLGGEASCHHPTTRRVIELDLCAFAWDLCAFA